MPREGLKIVLLFLTGIFFLSGCKSGLEDSNIQNQLEPPVDPSSTIATTSDVPVASATTLNTTINIAVAAVATATDPKGKSLTFIKNTDPINGGTVTNFNSGTGTFTYTPPNNYVGSDSFSFFVDNGKFTSNNATISIVINSTNVAPVLTLPANKLYPLDGTHEPIQQGVPAAFSISATDGNSDPLSLSCTVESVGLSASDPNLFATAPCNTLSSLTDFPAKTNVPTLASKFTTTAGSGTISWTPTSTQVGTYKFTITASDGELSTIGSFYVTVREAFSTTGILLGVDAWASKAEQSVPAIPRLNNSTDDINTTDWESFDNTSLLVSLTDFGTLKPWVGSGAVGVGVLSPYALGFSSINNDFLNLGNFLSGEANVMFSMWLSPNDVTATDSIILSTMDGTGKGFTLSQSNATNPGKLNFEVGNNPDFDSYFNYIVAFENPIRYWRLGETSGTTVVDEVGGTDGTYIGPVGLNAAGGLLGDSNTSITLADNAADYINVSSPLLPIFSFEAWIKPTALASGDGGSILKGSGTFRYLSVSNTGLLRYYDGGSYITAPGPTIGEWSHVGLTFNGNTQKYAVYLNGQLALQGDHTGASGAITRLGTDNNTRHFLGNIDEVIVYDYELTNQQMLNHYNIGKYGAYPNKTELVYGADSFWRMGDDALGTFTDYGAFQNDATIDTGTQSFTTQVPGNHQNDNAKAGYVGTNSTAFAQLALADQQDYDFIQQTGIFTISAWIAVEDYLGAGDKTFLSNSRFGAQPGFNAAYDGPNQRVYFHFNNGASSVPLYSVVGTIPDEGWHHVVYTGDGTQVQIYVDGAASGAPVAITPADTDAIYRMKFGMQGTSTALAYQGKIQDVAIYRKKLTGAEVADMYAQGYKGRCRSQTTMESGKWYHVAGKWDGTTGKLFVNGQRECEYDPGIAYASENDVIVGKSTTASSNYWNGKIADMKFFSSASDTSVKDHFVQSSNRFRETQMEDIVTDQLVLHYDPRFALDGLRANAKDSCDSYRYTDLSGNKHHGALYGFGPGNCGAGTEGWVGAGTPADPKALRFNAAEFVRIENHDAFNIGPKDVTIDFWAKIPNGNQTTCFICKRTLINNPQWGIWVAGDVNANTGTKLLFYSTGAGKLKRKITKSDVADNKWHHFAVVWDTTNQKLKIYIDGALQAQVAGDVGAWPGTDLDHIEPFSIGASLGKNQTVERTFKGDLGPIRLYNKVLTPQEIAGNCYAQKDRFLNATCFEPYSAPWEILNKVLWLRADTGVTHTANAVSEWRDQSSNEISFEQLVGGKEPTLNLASSAFGNKQSFVFDGGDFLSENTGWAHASSNYTILIAMKGGLPASQIVFDTQSGRFIYYHQHASAAVGGSGGLTGSPITGTTSQINTLRFENGAATFFVDGTAHSSGTYPQFSIGGNIAIGSDYNGGGNFLTGEIAEIIIFDRAITTSEKEAVECYFSDRYAITLDSNITCP